MQEDLTPVVTFTGPLDEGACRSFSYRDEYGIVAEGFVFRRNGLNYAYRNQCRHQPLTLDYGDGDVFTGDGRYLLCRNHGALFQPETGRCISGPCVGASLFPMKVVEKDSEVHVYAMLELGSRELE